MHVTRANKISYYIKQLINFEECVCVPMAIYWYYRLDAINPITWFIHDCDFPLLDSRTTLWKGNVFISVCQEFCPRGVSASGAPGIHPSPADSVQTETPWADIPHADTPLGRHQPSPRWPLQRTYASYLNAFLLTFFLTHINQSKE